MNKGFYNGFLSDPIENMSLLIHSVIQLDANKLFLSTKEKKTKNEMPSILIILISSGFKINSRDT